MKNGLRRCDSCFLFLFLISYSCLYPLVMELSPSKDDRLVCEWGMKKMDEGDENEGKYIIMNIFWLGFFVIWRKSDKFALA